MTKLYKEFVVLGVTLIGVILFGIWFFVVSSDVEATVDNKTPLPLELRTPEQSTNERTEGQSSDGQTNEIHSQSGIQ
jgi:hypothetical protein